MAARSSARLLPATTTVLRATTATPAIPTARTSLPAGDSGSDWDRTTTAGMAMVIGTAMADMAMADTATADTGVAGTETVR